MKLASETRKRSVKVESQVFVTILDPQTIELVQSSYVISQVLMEPMLYLSSKRQS